MNFAKGHIHILMKVLFVYIRSFMGILCSEVIFMGRAVGKILAFAGMAAVAAGTIAGYVFSEQAIPGVTAENSQETGGEISIQTDVQNDMELEKDASAETDEVIREAAKEASTVDGLDEGAVFTYEIYNDITNMSDSIKGSCPYELIGKSMSDVKDFYPDWQVTEFSSGAVTLRKNLGSENDERYVVGVYEGYVAVFYESSEEGIYMLTEIPVNTLEEDKQKMLEEGIYVEGRERLNRILEDYSS